MKFIALGALFGATGVVAGAFGAHALRDVLTPQQLSSYQTGTQYQLYHALLLVGIGLLLRAHSTARLLKWAGWLTTAGIGLFAGSIYLLTAGGVRNTVTIVATPLGGTLLVAAWFLLLLWAIRSLYSRRL